MRRRYGGCRGRSNAWSVGGLGWFCGGIGGSRRDEFERVWGKGGVVLIG
jgi:hypothetical protein